MSASLKEEITIVCTYWLIIFFIITVLFVHLHI